LLGVDSAFSLVEGLVAGIHDKFGIPRLPATIGVCVCGFLAGVIFCTQAGLLWIDIVDHWINSYGLVGVGLFEAILVGWAFKTARFKEHINSRSEIRIGLLWEICVKFLTPLVLIVTLVLAIRRELMEPYGGYPWWALLIGGWLVAFAAIGSGWLMMLVRRVKD
jgi:NSS family neurotransmitter:Na+ symporter